MRAQNEKTLTWVFAVVTFLVLFSFICFSEELPLVGDCIFLHNRLCQIRDCFQHGVFPFIYYEDLRGVGYGSPIFYGQATLFPFIFLADDISTFLKAYFLVCLVLNFFSFRCFAKRLSGNATLAAALYLLSTPFVYLTCSNLPANVMAVGFSWFFFAFCIDYFRDGKSFFLLILSYFGIWQSNFNALVLSTFVCFALFVVYFDKKRLKDYIKLVACVLLVVGFDIVNILCHLDSIRLTQPEDMLAIIKEGQDARVMSTAPIAGYLSRVWLKLDTCCSIMPLPMAAVFVYFVTRGVKMECPVTKKRLVILGVAFVVGYVVGVGQVWSFVYKATNLFFQFPLRYYIYLFGFVLAVLSRYLEPKWFVYCAMGLCLLDIFLVNPYRFEPSSGIYYEGLQFGNGEYAGEGFVQDYDVLCEYSSMVHSESGVDYPFEHFFNEVVVDCYPNESGHDVLTLPKLYYNWYKAYTEDGEILPVKAGYSDYCEVNIGSYRGLLTLTYVPPVWALVLFGIQVASVSGAICVALVMGSLYEKVRQVLVKLVKSS